MCTSLAFFLPCVPSNCILFFPHVYVSVTHSIVASFDGFIIVPSSVLSFLVLHMCVCVCVLVYTVKSQIVASLV